MMSALRRKWQGCQGTHSLLKRKLPWHEDTVLLQFNLRLYVVSEVRFHHTGRPNQTDRAGRPQYSMTLRIQLSPSELIRFGNNLLIPIQPRGQRLRGGCTDPYEYFQDNW